MKQCVVARFAVRVNWLIANTQHLPGSRSASSAATGLTLLQFVGVLWLDDQPALVPTFVGSLLPQTLLDIGVGQGLFSLAAAARGHRVIAMEASPRRFDMQLDEIRLDVYGCQLRRCARCHGLLPWQLMSCKSCS